MSTVSVHEAKTHLSRLIAAALAGDEVVIARGKEPVVRLVPINPLPPKRRQLGWLSGDSRGSDPLAYGFWDPLSDEEMGLGDDAPPA